MYVLNIFWLYLAIFLHFFLSLIRVKLADEYLPPLSKEVIEYRKVFGITGSERWPKPSHDDVDLLFNQLDDKYCHDYDSISHSPLKVELLNKSMCKNKQYQLYLSKINNFHILIHSF